MSRQTKDRQSKQDQTVTKLCRSLAVLATVALLAIGGLAWWGYNYTTGMVRTELAAQKIYFPVKGSPSLDPQEFPDLQQYAGQLVDNGPKAKAYANGFIGRHLEKVAGGKVYAEVSAEAKKDPTNVKLQQQKQTLFQGETLRGMLLGNGFAFWTFGKIAQAAAVVAFTGAACSAGLVVVFTKRLGRS